MKYCRDVLGINGFALLTNYRGVYLGDALLDPVMDEMNRRETLVTIHPTLPQQLIPGAASELPGPVMEYFFETTRSVVNMLLKGVLRKYKNLRFVIPHGGAFLTILSDRLIPMTSMLLKDSDIDIGGDLSHLYYDLAGFSMPKQFDLLRTITDDSHLFYGSDSPYTFLPVCIKQAELMDIKLGDVLSKKIYIDNPQKLFNDIGIFS